MRGGQNLPPLSSARVKDIGSPHHFSMRKSDTAIFIPNVWKSHSGSVVVGRYTVYLTTGRYVFGVICVGNYMLDM